MKKISTWIASGVLMVSITAVSQAGDRALIVIRPYPLVVAAPAAVVVAQPAPVPEYAPPPPDYGRVLTDFHARVERLQRMLDRQLRRRIITQRQYDRHADDLDAIVRDEQTDAARHNGGLTPREVDELNRRLTELQDRVHEDLAR